MFFKTCELQRNKSSDTVYPRIDIRQAIYKESISLTPEMAISMQKKGGYQTDNDWKKMLMGDVTQNLLIQSVIGKKSLICAPPNINSMSLEDFHRWTKQPLPAGTSQYLALPNAFADNLIHGYHFVEARNYHHLVQVGEVKCQKTGNTLYPLRKALAVFAISEWMQELPVLVARASANTEHGEGGAIQLIVPLELLRLLHSNVKLLITQEDNEYSVEKKEGLYSPWKIRSKIKEAHEIALCSEYGVVEEFIPRPET
ncbi:TPA: hypothetical protein I8Z93_002089 [Legionella pneumophila]|uniref:hypothetical protein n=1 Tax=Legionella pneumophila TaxID=446 RepID=UPI001A1DF0B2|nr:hypothetical protein [Legionella pneumophila]